MDAFFSWLFHSSLTPAFWFQPLFYSVHGWLATEMALWMLFHPYQPIYLPGTKLQLPFTPGILPRGRQNLFQSIADTVTQTLLTEADIQRQAEALVTEENILHCIDAALDSLERELRNREQIRGLYRYGDEVLPALFQQAVSRFLDAVESSGVSADRKRQDVSVAIRERLVDGVAAVLPKLRLNYHQAEFFTDALFNTLLTPAYLRHMLVESLTESNILLVEKTLSTQIGGVKGFLVRFMGVEQTLAQLKTFCQEQPEEAEKRLTECLDRLEVRERLTERISRFSFADLPEETRLALMGYLGALMRETVSDHRADLERALASWSGQLSRLLVNRVLQLDVKRWLNESHPSLKPSVAVFIKRYLNRELALIIGNLLPVLGIGCMIVEKLEQFTNAQLEQMIYGICRRELRWLAFLGAFLGFWLGLMSNIINFWLQASPHS